MNNQFIAPYLRKRWEDARKKVQTLSPELFPQSSYLRIDQPLVNGVGNYVFDPMRQNGQQGTYGQLLNRNDFYGGSLRLQTGTTVTFEALETSIFNVSHQAANSGTTETAVVSLDSSVLDEIFYTPEMIAFAGTKEQTFSLKFPCANTSVFQPASSPKGSVGLSLVMLGFLVKNGALLLENYKGDVNDFLAPA